jgi:hypothetical protein
MIVKFGDGDLQKMSALAWITVQYSERTSISGMIMIGGQYNLLNLDSMTLSEQRSPSGIRSSQSFVQNFFRQQVNR